MSKKTLKALLELAMEWETGACDLYAHFAKIFSHEPTVAVLWTQLSRDESGHIAVLKDILHKMPAEKCLMEVDMEHWNSVAGIEELIRNASGRKVLTLDDAYEVAHQLETSEVNTLFRMLVTDYMPDEKGHELVVSEVTEHIERLVRFGKGYTRSQRRLIKSRSL